MIIGVTGATGAGKTTFVRYLSAKGFEHLSLSDMIRNELNLRGMEITRENLQDVGNEMRRKFGLGVWAKKVLDIMRPGRNYVIDSIRNPGEIETLAASGDFALVAVTAPLEARFLRMSCRAERGEKEPATLAAFEKSEAREADSEQSCNQQLDQCVRMAKIIIPNESGLAEFFTKIDKNLSDFQAKNLRSEI